MSTFTQQLLLENPVPFDPATQDTWGATENNGRTLVDSAVAGILPLPVPGAANVILTSNQGTPDQARNAHFQFSGLLTGNIVVFWPNGRNRMFSVSNGTTGAFTLTVAVDNGAGAPAGTTVAIPRGYSVDLVSDGTNITERANALGSGPIVTGTVLPPGLMFDYAATAAPAGWLLCDGSAVSRTTYAALFAVIGTTFGSGNGTTTFNVPDARGRTTVGVDNMGGVAANRITNAVSGITGTTLGAAGGDQRLQVHSHGVNDPGHAHTGGDGAPFMTNAGGAIVVALGPGFDMGIANTATAGTGVSLQNAGAGAAQNVQPTLMVTKIIKT